VKCHRLFKAPLLHGALMAAALWLMAEPAAARVLIIQSDELPQYDAPTAAFQQAAGTDTVVVNIAGSRDHGERRLREAVAADSPRAVYALGAQAAYLARQVLPDTPMVFSMVVGWQRYGFERGPVTGVAVEIPVEALFTRFKLMLPGLDRLGVIYSTSTDAKLIERAREAAAELKIELVEEDVLASDEVPGAYRRMHTEIDALWMLPDPVVVTRTNFAHLAEQTRKHDVMFLAFSENFVRAGALLSVAPSYATMGWQAAALLERLLADPDNPPAVQPPMGSKLVVNAETARGLDLDLDAATIGMADEIVDLAKAEEEER
jgi:putative ABC transport system substrate-binding protein